MFVCCDPLSPLIAKNDRTSPTLEIVHANHVYRLWDHIKTIPPDVYVMPPLIDPKTVFCPHYFCVAALTKSEPNAQQREGAESRPCSGQFWKCWRKCPIVGAG
jgi:hypothetical protein